MNDTEYKLSATQLKVIDLFAKIVPCLVPIIEIVKDHLLSQRASTSQIAKENISKLESTNFDVKVDEEDDQGDVSTTIMAQRFFLTSMEKSLGDSRDRLSNDLNMIRKNEKTVFSLFVVLALIGLLFICVGGFLFLSGNHVIGILSEILGVISGSGSAVIRSMRKAILEKRLLIDKEHKEQTQVLQAVQAAMAIPGDAGIEEMKNVAGWLRDRVANT